MTMLANIWTTYRRFGLANFIISWILYIDLSSCSPLTRDSFEENSSKFSFGEPARVVDKRASCDDRFIYFKLVFNQPFRGVVYSEGSFKLEKCVYVNGTSGPSTQYNVSIPLDDCNSKKFPNGTSQNILIVQQDPKIMEIDDNLYFITCQIDPLLTSSGRFRRIGNNESTYGGGFGLSADDFSSNERRITLSFLGLTVQSNVASTEIVTNVAPISLDYSAEVQLGTGAPNSPPVDRVLRVGEPLSYVVRLRNLRNLDARVGRCWATDKLGSDIQLSNDEGCSLQTGLNSKIWSEFRLYPDKTHDADKILYNDIKTWAFPTSNRVHIYCNLHMCLQQCPNVTCIGNRRVLSSSKREKRDTEEDSTNGITITNRTSNLDNNSTTFRLESGYLVSNLHIDQSAEMLVAATPQNGLLADFQDNSYDRKLSKYVPNAKVCLSETNFLFGLTILALIIVLCLLFILYFILRTCWHCCYVEKPASNILKE